MQTFTFCQNYSEIFCKMVIHCVKSVQIWSFFWYVFSYILSEYRKIRTGKKSVFGHFSRSYYLKKTWKPVICYLKFQNSRSSKKKKNNYRCLTIYYIYYNCYELVSYVLVKLSSMYCKYVMYFPLLHPLRKSVINHSPCFFYVLFIWMLNLVRSPFRISGYDIQIDIITLIFNKLGTNFWVTVCHLARKFSGNLLVLERYR